jgi:hypothetical protein
VIRNGRDRISRSRPRAQGVGVRLSAIDPRKGRVVELRFFGGLTIDETAELLGTAPATDRPGSWSSTAISSPETSS